MFACFGSKKEKQKRDPMRGAMVYRQAATEQRQREQIPPPGFEQNANGPHVYDARGNVMRAEQLAAESMENTAEGGRNGMPVSRPAGGRQRDATGVDVERRRRAAELAAQRQAEAQARGNGNDFRNGNNPMFHNRTNGGETRIQNIIQVRAVETYDNAAFGLVNRQGPQRSSPLSTDVRSRAGSVRSARGQSPERSLSRSRADSVMRSRADSRAPIDRLPTSMSMEVASGNASEGGNRWYYGQQATSELGITRDISGYGGEDHVDLGSESESEYSLDELNPLLMSEMRQQQEQMEDDEFNEQMRL